MRNSLSSQVVNEPVAVRTGPTGYSLLTLVLYDPTSISTYVDI